MTQQIKFQKYFGTYTAQRYGESSNSNIKYDKSSSSMSLISRKLLTPDEVMKIENPYAIIIVFDKLPVIANVPDISKMHFNKLNGIDHQKIIGCYVIHNIENDKYYVGWICNYKDVFNDNKGKFMEIYMKLS